MTAIPPLSIEPVGPGNSWLGASLVGRLRTLSDRLPLLWLLWSIPFGLSIAWITPPWQNPDEPAHFLRMAQISSGGMIGHRYPAQGVVGGEVDPGIIAAFSVYTDMLFHRARKDTQELETRARGPHWSGQTILFSFGNTAVYPAIFYAPGALLLRLARIGAMSIVSSLLLVRALNVVIAGVLVAIGLRLSRRTRPALLALAVLPMNVFLMASASQDALMLASVTLAVGWCDGLTARSGTAKRWELVALALLLASVGMARPIYIFLLGMLPMVWPRRREAVVAMALAACCVFGWIAACLPIAPFASNAAPMAQMQFLLTHLSAIPGLLARTWEVYGTIYWISFIGDLGMLDTPLPQWFCAPALAVVGLALLSSTSGPARSPWVAFAAVCLGVAAMFGIEYLTWTSVGGPVIEGIQGRYLLPLAAVLALAVPGCPALGRRLQPWASIAVLALMLVTPAVTLRALVLRYYLG